MAMNIVKAYFLGISLNKHLILKSSKEKLTRLPVQWKPRFIR